MHQREAKTGLNSSVQHKKNNDLETRGRTLQFPECALGCTFFACGAGCAPPLFTVPSTDCYHSRFPRRQRGDCSLAAITGVSRVCTPDYTPHGGSAAQTSPSLSPFSYLWRSHHASSEPAEPRTPFQLSYTWSCVSTSIAPRCPDWSVEALLFSKLTGENRRMGGLPGEVRELEIAGRRPQKSRSRGVPTSYLAGVMEV